MLAAVPLKAANLDMSKAGVSKQQQCKCHLDASCLGLCCETEHHLQMRLTCTKAAGVMSYVDGPVCACNVTLRTS